MTAEGFTNTSIFEKFSLHIFGKRNVKFSVILSVDGHRTQLTYQLSELCSELGVTLISVYPNATRLLQAVDVATFRPLNLGLKTSFLECHRQKSDKILNKEWFGFFLDTAQNKCCLACSAVLGFRACGLYLWDPETLTSKYVLEKSNCWMH
jgi:hypothetical protein